MTSQPFAIPALIFFIVSVPLLFGLIPRNRFYGVRTRKTLSEDRVWYAVNRLAAAGLMIAGVVYGLVALLVPYNRSASDDLAKWGIHLAAFVVPLVIVLVLVRAYGKRL